MIESILIKNFRGIKTGQMDRFRKFNLLVGPNNSGKSTVLEALYLATTADRPARITISHIQNGYDGKVSDSDLLGYLPMTRVLNRHNYEPSSLHIAHQEETRIFTNTSAGPLGNADIVFKPVSNRVSPDQEEVIAIFALEATADSSYKNPEEAYNNFAKHLFKGEVNLSEWNKIVFCLEPNLIHFGAEHACWLVKGRLAPSQHTYLYDVSMMLGHIPMNFFRHTIKTVPGWTQRIAKHFRQVLGIKAPFNVQFLPPDQKQKWAQGWIAPENQSALTVDTYGDGARSTFKVLTPLIALAVLAKENSPGLFLWEEPELFQNPRALGQLLAEVAMLMKDKPMQLFIATHSLEVIATFTALVQEGKIEREDLMAFRLGLQDGKLSSSWFNADNLTAWLEEGLDPRVWGDFKSPLQFSFREEEERE